MRCEACGYQFLLVSSTKCPDCGDLREAIVVENYDFLTANTVPIMDSIVGIKAANAHLVRRVAELGAKNIELHDARRAIAIDAKARIETLESQLAAQALAHAEQMEGARKSRHDPDDLSDFDAAFLDDPAPMSIRECDMERRIAELEEKNASLSKSVVSRGHIIAKLESQLAMRVAATARPTDAQQTASDVKTTQEPKAFPAGALKAGGSDPRRIGG